MDGTTGIVLTVVFGLVALVLGILNYITKKNEQDSQKASKQTELEVKLINIEKELIEIKGLLITSTLKYETLEKNSNQVHECLDKKIIVLEQKIINLEEKKVRKTNAKN